MPFRVRYSLMLVPDLCSARIIEPARYSGVVRMQQERNFQMAREWQATQWENMRFPTQKLGRAPTRGRAGA